MTLLELAAQSKAVKQYAVDLARAEEEKKEEAENARYTAPKKGKPLKIPQSLAGMMDGKNIKEEMEFIKPIRKVRKLVAGLFSSLLMSNTARFARRSFPSPLPTRRTVERPETPASPPPASPASSSSSRNRSSPTEPTALSASSASSASWTTTSPAPSTSPSSRRE